MTEPGRKRVLFVSQTSPFFTTSGFAHRALMILRWLTRHYNVDVVCQDGARPLSHEERVNFRLNNVLTVPEGKRTFGGLSKAAFGLFPFHQSLAFESPLADACRTVLKSRSYDLIVLVKTTLLFPILEVAKDTPVIVEQQAFAVGAWDNLVKNYPSMLARLFFRFDRWRVKRFERKAHSLLSGVICITPEDLQSTEETYPGVRAIYIPYAIDSKEFPKSELGVGPKACLLFCGTGAVRNVEAVNYFVTEILPKVRKVNSETELLWIGNVERGMLPDTISSEVRCTGFVENVHEYYREGAIFIAPFTMGEGMKIKIIEALALGKVVVATRVGARGISSESLPFLLIRNTPEEFADAILWFQKSEDLA